MKAGLWWKKVFVYICILGYYKVFFYKGHLKQFTNNNKICSVLHEEFYALTTSDWIVSFKVSQLIILLLRVLSQSHECMFNYYSHITCNTTE